MQNRNAKNAVYCFVSIKTHIQKTNPGLEDWIQAQNRKPGMPAEHLFSLEACIKRKQMLGSELGFNLQAHEWFYEYGSYCLIHRIKLYKFLHFVAYLL